MPETRTTVVVRPSPFVLQTTAGAPAHVAGITRIVAMPLIASPRVEVGQVGQIQPPRPR
jgi:hypothetical protein